MAESIEQALTPDQRSVVAYAGKVTQRENVTIFLEDGTAVTKEIDIVISWDSIMEIMGLIRRRARIGTPLAVFKSPLEPVE